MLYHRNSIGNNFHTSHGLHGLLTTNLTNVQQVLIIADVALYNDHYVINMFISTNS